jgi:DNA (cytosine-5)-methyltransferase 1
MMENVPRLAEDQRMREVLKRLRELGYVGKPVIFNAADFGVPQRRRRMILIASRIGEIGYASPFPKADRKTVEGAIAHLPVPGTSGDVLHDLPEQRSPALMKIIRLIPKDGGSRRNLGKKHQLDCHLRSGGFKDVYGRMKWNDVSPTITGGCVNPSKGRFLHPEQDRAITVREASLLQGFPPDYSFSLNRGKYAAALLIGNAFPPKFGEVHARQIIRALSSENKG